MGKGQVREVGRDTVMKEARKAAVYMTKLKAQGWQIDKIKANLETRYARHIKAAQTSSSMAQPECKSYKTTLLAMKTAIYQVQCDWSENRCLFVLMHKLEVQKPKNCVVALPLQRRPLQAS